MEDVLLEKSNLRKELLALRAAIPSELKEQFDLAINAQLQNWIVLHQPKVVHCYLPMGAEIDITPTILFCLSKDIKIIAPKTLKQRKLENRILHSLDQIEKGIWGTAHPTGELYEGAIDMIIVPGLAFDEQRYRLGYGGGYYDNFLVQYPDAKKIGIFYSMQKRNAVPKERHDISLDLIFTEQ
jgi:5-formyltetrahydrofolate cyclo-ligase